MELAHLFRSRRGKKIIIKKIFAIKEFLSETRTKTSIRYAKENDREKVRRRDIYRERCKG